MAKKKSAFKGDRSDPKANKSLAVRTVLKAMPKAKAAEVATEVQKQFGHTVSLPQIYMIKTKLNIRAKPKAERQQSARESSGRLTSTAEWVNAIKYAKQLLAATGSAQNAMALLKAIEG